MNASFQIQPAPDQSLDTSQCNLLLEVSPDYVLSGIIDPAESRFSVLEYFRLEPHDALNSFKTVVFNNEWFSRPFNSVKIIYNFPDSLVIPAALHRQETLKESLDLVFGDAHPGEIFSEYLSSWDSFNVYRVPALYTSVIRAHFVQPQPLHLHSIVLKKLAAESNDLRDNHVFVIFYERKLVVACTKDNRLVLIQTYAYETAEDVNYLLLNICNRLHLDCEQVRIRISGLLDDHSSVYNEMRKYFLDVALDNRPEALSYSEGFDEYPPHFFNSVYWAALCG